MPALDTCCHRSQRDQRETLLYGVLGMFMAAKPQLDAAWMARFSMSECVHGCKVAIHMRKTGHSAP